MLISKILKIAFTVALLSSNVLLAEHPEKDDFSKVNYQQQIIPLMEKYCYDCHDSLVQKGDVDLASFTSDKSIVTERKTWLKCLELLNNRTMPAEKKGKRIPLPTEAERMFMVKWIDYRLKNIDWTKIKHAGHVTIARLNQVEYNNALRDLLNWDVKPGRNFGDNLVGKSGFNNDNDSLFISGALMDKYLNAAEKVLSDYINISGPEETVTIDSDQMQSNYKSYQASPGHYLFTNSQSTIYNYFDFKYHGYYEFSIRAWAYRNDHTKVPLIAVNIDNLAVAYARVLSNEKEVADYKFVVYVEKGIHQVSFVKKLSPVTVGSDEEKVPFSFIDFNPEIKHIPTPEKSDPLSSVRKVLLAPAIRKEITAVDYYSIRGPLKKLPQQAITKGRTFKLLDQSLDVIYRYYKRLLKARLAGQIEAGLGKQQMDMRLLKYVEEELTKFVEKRKKYRRDELPSVPEKYKGIVWCAPLKSFNFKLPDNDFVFYITPGNTPQSKKSAAEKILRRFATRAWRRPLSADKLAQLMTFYEKQADRGLTFKEALKLPLTAILISPHFLYRAELQKNSGSQAAQLSDYELASRLSFFLWMSIPDDELLKLAGQNKLHHKSVLKQQIQRMLQDEKSASFSMNFSRQWLGYYKLLSEIKPDTRKFPEYSPELRTLMMTEADMFMAAIIKNNGSFLDILDSNYTYVNQELASFYAYKGVKGDEFRKIKITDPRRGGVMGMAAILSANSSNPVRTSPVDRGKWALETLFGETLPDPPADVLPLDTSETDEISVRKSLEKHRQLKSCAVCHDKIDPIGFAMEHFDSIGKLKKHSDKIETHGVLPSGEKFADLQGLRRLLLKRQDKFSRSVVENMLKFALGRELEYYDESLVKKIMLSLQNGGFKAHLLIEEIVFSVAFQFQNNSKQVEQ